MGLDHLFHLGSLGELFLGAAAVRAALLGHVEQDAPVSAYAPDLPEGTGRAASPSCSGAGPFRGSSRGFRPGAPSSLPSLLERCQIAHFMVPAGDPHP